MENLEAVRRWSKWRRLKSRSALASRIKAIFALILSGCRSQPRQFRISARICQTSARSLKTLVNSPVAYHAARRSTRLHRLKHEFVRVMLGSRLSQNQRKGFSGIVLSLANSHFYEAKKRLSRQSASAPQPKPPTARKILDDKVRPQ
jgi:hypothetical protein